MTVRRVFLVVWWFDDSGGMEEHVAELACALRRKGIEVTVLCEMPVARSNVYAARLAESGIPLFAGRRILGVAALARIVPWRVRRAVQLVHSLWLLGFRALGGLDRRPESSANRGIAEMVLGTLAGNLGSSWLMAALERERRLRAPDLVHVHGCRLGQSWVLRWAALNGIPCVYTEHVNVADWGGPGHPDAPDLLARSADAVACVSEQAGSSLRAVLPIPRTISLTRHIVRAPEGSRCREPVPPNPVRFASVARLEPHKGIDVLLRAFAILSAARPGVHLTIVGDGSEARALRRLALDLGIGGRVSFLGRCSRDDVHRLLDASHVAVMPSLSEGMPLALLEALAWGLPVVASNVGGIPEVVRHRVNGLLVSPADVAALAAAMEMLADDPALRRELGEAGLRSFRSLGFDEPAVLASILDLYRAAGERRTGVPARTEELRAAGV